MYLKIISPDREIFNWEIEKITLPTLEWEISILENHMPLVFVLKPWIIKIFVKEDIQSLHIKDDELLFYEKTIQLSIFQWIWQIENNNIKLTISQSNVWIKDGELALNEMKKKLSEQIEQAKSQVDLESYEKLILELEKINNDLRMLKKSWF